MDKTQAERIGVLETRVQNIEKYHGDRIKMLQGIVFGIISSIVAAMGSIIVYFLTKGN